MNTVQWICFVTLALLALMSRNSTDYAVFMTGAILLWALTEPPKKGK